MRGSPCMIAQLVRGAFLAIVPLVGNWKLGATVTSNRKHGDIAIQRH